MSFLSMPAITMKKAIPFVSELPCNPALTKEYLAQSTSQEFLASYIHKPNITSLKREAFSSVIFFQKRILIENYIAKKKVFDNCNYSNVDTIFYFSGIKLAHKYGITLGSDFLGADSQAALRATEPVVQDSEVGCCGMAGSFCYDKEHTAFSRQIAAQKLLPRLAKVPRCLCSSQRFFLPPPDQ